MTYGNNSKIPAGIDIYSLASFRSHSVSASSADVEMNPIDSVALRAMNAVMSFYRNGY